MASLYEEMTQGLREPLPQYYDRLRGKGLDPSSFMLPAGYISKFSNPEAVQAIREFSPMMIDALERMKYPVRIVWPRVRHALSPGHIPSKFMPSFPDMPGKGIISEYLTPLGRSLEAGGQAGRMTAPRFDFPSKARLKKPPDLFEILMNPRVENFERAGETAGQTGYHEGIHALLLNRAFNKPIMTGREAALLQGVAEESIPKLISSGTPAGRGILGYNLSNPGQIAHESIARTAELGQRSINELARKQAPLVQDPNLMNYFIDALTKVIEPILFK